MVGITSTPGLVPVSPPYTPPPIVLDEGWTKAALTWIDWQGTRWPLSNPKGGFELLPGVLGLEKPTYTTYRDKSPAVAGAYYRGFSVEEREVSLNLAIFHDGSTQEWMDIDSAFSAGMRPDRPGTLEVVTPRGTRSLRMRYSGGMDMVLDKDPLFFGWVKYPLTLVADSPLFEGEPVVKTFKAVAPVEFFPPGGGPPFNVSGSRLLDSARVTNDGDFETNPVLTIHGPTTGPTSISIGGNVTSFDFLLGVNDELVIDTSPRRQTALLNGVTNKISSLTQWAFGELAPGTNIPITISMTGVGGWVTVSFVPKYERAW